MPAPRDPYQVLGLPRAATQAEVRAAYRLLVARYHPDKHQGNPLEDLASERMAEINRAYEMLTDPVGRHGSQGADRAAGRPAPSAGATSAGPTSAGPTSAGRRSPAWSGASSHPAQRGKPPAPARLMKWLPLLLVFPLVIRMGGGIARAIGALARIAFEAAGALRGGPLAAGAALLLAVLLIFAVIRRRKRPPDHQQKQSTSRGR